MAIGSTGKRILMYGSFFIAVILFIRQAGITYNDTLTYGGTDLRARIVGTRLMNNGLNPYFTKWNPTLGERLCDPNDKFDRKVNGVTATPFLLWLQTPLAHFDYGTIRVTWWGLQQLLLLSIAFVCLYFYKSSWASAIAIVISFGLLANHLVWIFHAERGQIYILYAAWLVILFMIWHRSRNQLHNVIILGAWLAFGVLIRPTLLVFAVPSFLYTVSGKRTLLIASCCLSIIILLFVSNTWVHWQSYLSAMQVYSNMEQYGNMHLPLQPPEFPATIEGTTNITIYKQHPGFMYVASLEYYFKKIGYKPANVVYLFLCVFINSILLMLVYRKTRFSLEKEQFYMLGILFYTCTEVCQPLRAVYNLIVWLPAVLVMVAYVFNYKTPTGIFVSNSKSSSY